MNSLHCNFNFNNYFQRSSFIILAQHHFLLNKFHLIITKTQHSKFLLKFLLILLTFNLFLNLHSNYYSFLFFLYKLLNIL